MQNMTSYIYFFMALNLLFLISIILPAAWLIFTTPNLLNVIALGLAFPGIAALCSCCIKYKEASAKRSYKVLKSFLEGYRKNFKDTLKYCFVYALLIFVISFNVNAYDTDSSIFPVITTAILAILSTIIVTYMMIIATKFQFKLKDLFKISIYCILMHFKITLKISATYTVLFFAYPWVGAFTILLFISPICYLIVHFAHPVLADVYQTFVEKVEDE